MRGDRRNGPGSRNEEERAAGAARRGVEGERVALPRTEAEWRARLTPEQYRVCRLKGTEPPFTGAYWSTKEPGLYRCVCCGSALFSSDAKYDSDTGWPSFWAPVAPDAVATAPDRSLPVERTEVLCRRCGAHLGHVFADGPEPTGLRYCINSVALSFERRG